jgi:hypothetical protein
MKLSDYIVQRLARWGVRHVFLATGGGAMSCPTHSRNLNRAHERSKCPMAPFRFACIWRTCTHSWMRLN